MGHVFDLGQALQAGDVLRANEQTREFNSLRASGERQRQDIAQRTFNAEEQRANTFKFLNGVRIAQQNPNLLPRIGQQLVDDGILDQAELTPLLQSAQTDPQAFQQGLEDLESELMFALSEAPAQPTFGAPVAGVGAEGPEFRRFAPTGESRAVEGFAPPARGVGGGDPSAVQLFNTLSEAAAEVGLDGKPTRRAIQAQTQLGTRARAGTTSSRERIATDPELTEDVA